jgi:hypothetical protein
MTTNAADSGRQDITMTVADACLPSLQAGQYVVTVSQTLTDRGAEISGNKDGRPTLATPGEFWVAGPRFTLPSSAIYATYPPADARDSFSEALPHVVLERRTLPWERALVAPPKSDDRPRPWLALLLLDEDDLRLHGDAPILPRTVALSEVLGPGREAAPWERPTDSCTVLDLPFALFAEIAPSWNDLAYLAHARHVASRAHMDTDGIEDDGWFSVVVGNRTPTAGKEHGAYLVSLEGLEPWLPTHEPAPEDRDPTGSTSPASVRVVVLASWRFVDDTKGKGFRGLVTTLTNDPKRDPAHDPARDPALGPPSGPLRLAPERAGAADGAPASDPRKQVERALASGYVPLRHQTRQGHHTVSWYRGPLAPEFLPTSPQNRVYANADAALRYDRFKGLLDVSYAAAWQLGRLLALRDRHVVRALHALKLGALQRAADDAARAALVERFGAGAARDWTEIATRFLESHPLTQPKRDPGAGPASVADRPDPYAALQSALARSSTAVELPAEVRRFLGRLFLLHGVPLGYLVPHPDLLSPESLRTFYLDTSWVAALLDGALAAARVSQSAVALDQAMTGRFLREIVNDTPIAAGTVSADAVTREGVDLGDPDITEVVGHLTGFLLRSRLVSGWPGLEIRAEDGQQVLRALRLQRVAPDTLLGIYAGQLRRLVITQPPQGVHFGVSRGAARHPESQAIDVPTLAASHGCTDKPAQLGAALLVGRVEHTIEIDITTARPTDP